MSKQLFWGWIDVYDKVHVKRYTTDRAIENAEKAPLTRGIFGPFYAKDMVEAKKLVMNTYVEEVIMKEPDYERTIRH